nr:ribonuclease H-like domain-containing protein [Tanacetum cinerariifolium]
MKFEKDYLCSACEQGKIHQKHHKSKMAFASNKPLYLLHMDLCGPMRVESINGKRYMLVVGDDFSRYTWVFFLHSKDKASEVIISFIKKAQVNLQLQVQRVQTDNGMKFKNNTLAKFFDEVGTTQQFSAARTPQQNGVVERRNRTLVEAIVMANSNPRHLLDYDDEEDPEMDIEENEDADIEEDDDADIEEDDDAEIIFPYEVQGDQTPPPRDESFDSDSEPEAEEADNEPEAEEAGDELEVEEDGVEPEAEGADVELEAEEPNGVPEATIGTGSQRPFDVRDFPMGFYEARESSTAHDPQFVGGLEPWALRRDLEALRRHERIREAES